MSEPETIPDQVSKTLRIISGAMAWGLVMMAGLVAWSYANAATVTAEIERVRSINTLTTIGMIAALGAIALSEALWRSTVRNQWGHGGKQFPLSGRVQSGFIIRLALREGAALLGLTVCYVAALNGVLRVYPAYWVNLAPFVLFLGFLAAHWPTAKRLNDEVRDTIGFGPISPQ